MIDTKLVGKVMVAASAVCGTLSLALHMYCKKLKKEINESNK